MNEFRKYINIVEGRNPDFEYDSKKAGRVVLQLKSYNSRVYTKLAQKLTRIDELSTEIKELKKYVKQSTREDIADLFDATDIVNTRVIETVSFTFTLSKDPKATVTPKYKEIVEELATHLTPELIKILEGLKTKWSSETQKPPSLKYEKNIDESFTKMFHKLKSWAKSWASTYDQRLNQLKAMI